MTHPRESLRAALTEIVEGRTVKRSQHELIYEGEDVSDLFIEILQHRGFVPVTVGATAVEPGQRLPAFYLKEGTAYFGWIFWEKFSQLRLRKLFGTVVRNAKGDWLIQLPSNSTAIIYTGTSQIFEMDIDRPFEL